MVDISAQEQGASQSESSELAEIDSLLEQLREFEGESKAIDKPRAKNVLATIIPLLQEHKDWLLANGIIATYHGSLQYNDPVHADLDISFFSSSPLTEEQKQRLWALERQYDVLSRITNQGAPNFLFYSLEELTGNIGKTERVEGMNTLAACEMRSSKTFFSEQEGPYGELRSEVRRVLGENPHFRQEVTVGLQEVLNQRALRRSA